MTAERKRRASQQNAWRHGLSISISVQPYFADLLRDFETSLEWDTALACSMEDSRTAVMIAIFEVLRARAVRAHILDQLVEHCDPSVRGTNDVAGLMQHLLRADRYESRALSRRKCAIRLLSQAA
jgi:hypothetical protein